MLRKVSQPRTTHRSIVSASREKMWFKNNDLSEPITEFRMTVHLFGNDPSPAVATYDLRRTVDEGEEHDLEVKKFVQRNFYVDDCLVSIPKAEEVVTLIRNTEATLTSANLKLHKVVSNSVRVMKAFPTADLAKDIHSLDLRQDNLLAKRLRCDRSSNFVSRKSELDEPSAEMDKKSVERYLSEAENSSSTPRTRLILAWSGNVK